jgi:hypothetical protein
MSAAVTYAGYAMIAALSLVWTAFTLVRRPRYATADALAARVMRHPVARGAVWALWAWIGWHLFVRGRGAFT